MTAEQIMEAINKNKQSTTINSLEEMNNLKDSNGVPIEEIPFENISDVCLKELQQSMDMLPEYDTPQEKLKGFSQHQIDRINQFKKNYDILNDTMFDNYVKTWDKTLTGKKDITPSNVDTFLKWVDELGKMVC